MLWACGRCGVVGVVCAARAAAGVAKEGSTPEFQRIPIIRSAQQ